MLKAMPSLGGGGSLVLLFPFDMVVKASENCENCDKNDTNRQLKKLILWCKDPIVIVVIVGGFVLVILMFGCR